MKFTNTMLAASAAALALGVPTSKKTKTRQAGTFECMYKLSGLFERLRFSFRHADRRPQSSV